MKSINNKHSVAKTRASIVSRG